MLFRSKMATDGYTTPKADASSVLIAADETQRSELMAMLRDFPGFPKPGIVFCDIFPVFKHPGAVQFMVNAMAATCRDIGIDGIVAVEARGFLFGPLLAQALDLPFAPVRKAGKLPGDKKTIAYGLEYGAAMIEMQADALPRGSRVVVCDDLLATGGTLVASISLCRELGFDVRAAMVMVELEALEGAKSVPAPVYTFVKK